LPFCHVTLRGQKPIHREKYPDVCRTWGDWIKCRRLDLKLTKRQLSRRFHVDDTTIYLWERNRVRPSLAQIPKIIAFLGYDPFGKKPDSLGEKIREYLQTHGLTQKKLAGLFGVDESTLAGWENGKHRPSKGLQDKLKSFFES
jgi:transcriptional regulator with XRE-family HTH domain